MRPTPLGFVLLCLITICACNDSQLVQAQKSDVTAYLGQENIIDSNTIAFPVMLSQDGSSVLSDLSKDRYETHTMVNLLFHDIEVNESWFLAPDKKMILTSSMVKKGPKRILEEYLFYTLIEKDHNEDGDLNHKDPVYLYLSDHRGKNFMQISPVNESLVSWKFIGGTDIMLLRTVRDFNKDGKFDGQDPRMVYRIDFNGLLSPQNILDEQLNEQLQNIINQHLN